MSFSLNQQAELAKLLATITKRIETAKYDTAPCIMLNSFSDFLKQHGGFKETAFNTAFIEQIELEDELDPRVCVSPCASCETEAAL